MPGDFDVGAEILLRKDFRRDVVPFDRLADDLVVLWIFRFRFARRVKRIADLAVPGERDVEIAPADKFGVAHALGHFGIAVNQAAVDHELRGGNAKFFGGKIDQHPARFGGSGAQLLAAFLNA